MTEHEHVRINASWSRQRTDIAWRISQSEEALVGMMAEPDDYRKEQAARALIRQYREAVHDFYIANPDLLTRKDTAE